MGGFGVAPERCLGSIRKNEDRHPYRGLRPRKVIPAFFSVVNTEVMRLQPRA